MRKLIAILAVALAIPTMSFADQVGRYQMYNVQNHYMYILDTKTGIIRVCYNDGKKKAPICSPTTDASK